MYLTIVTGFVKKELFQKTISLNIARQKNKFVNNELITACWK